MIFKPVSKITETGSRTLSFMCRDEPAMHALIEQKYCRKLINCARVKKDLETAIAAFSSALDVVTDDLNGEIPRSINAHYPAEGVKLQSLVCNGFVSYGRAFVDSAIDHKRLYSTDEGKRYAELHKWAMEHMRHGYFAHSSAHPFDVPVVVASFRPMASMAYSGLVSNLNFCIDIGADALADMIEMAEFALAHICEKMQGHMADLDRFLHSQNLLPSLAKAAKYVTEFPPIARPPSLPPKGNHTARQIRTKPSVD